MIRGLGFNRITVTENGVKQEGQQWGADHGLEIDAFNAGQVSVRKGPSSLLYGSDAMGGAIEVKPATPNPGMSTRLSTSLGSYLTGQHRLAQAMRWEKFYYSAAAGVSHTAGDRPSSAFRDQDASLNMAYTLSPVWRTSIEGRYGHFHVEDPGPVTAPLAKQLCAGRPRRLQRQSRQQRQPFVWDICAFNQATASTISTDGFRSTDSTTVFRFSQNFAL
jgi:outer membrane receptor protein involved in Fe transport